MSTNDDPADDKSDTAIPRCAVVVSSRNRSEKIAPLVSSILRSSEPNFEMVLIDQSDDAVTGEIIRPFLADRRIRYVRSEQRGTSRGRNLGISLTTAPFVVITDDDCVAPTDWIAHMMRPFEQDPRVGMVFCNVDPVPGDALGMTPSVRFSESRTLTTLEEGWESARAYSVLGAGMAVRRTMFEALRGFDELLGPGSTFPACEDNELMWRALARQWSVYHSTETSVLHDGFRNIDEVRNLVRRDCCGAGGAMAKYVKARHWGVIRLIAAGLFNLGIREPIRDIMARRVPRGFRRPYWVLQGVARGLRTPMNRSTLLYRHVDTVTPGGGDVQPAARPARR